MNILYINNKYKLFKDSDSGASNRSTMFIRSLAQFAKVDIISFAGPCNVDAPNCNVVYNELKKDSIIELSTLRKISQLIPPYKIGDFYDVDKVKSSIVSNLYGKKKYDYVACRYIDEAIKCGLLRYSNNLIIDVDDNPKDIAKMLFANSTGLTKLHGLLYSRAISSITKKILSQVKCSFYSSPTGKPYKASVFLPNIAMLNGSLEDINENTQNNILMVGWLVYYPNINGSLHFAKDVMPKIISEVPDAKFYIAGKAEDSSVINQLSSFNGVYALGFVKDLAEVYKKAKVVVIPVYEGTGTSIKLLEAMQMNRPVVSTRMGVRGYKKYLQSGADYLEANDDSDFALKVIKLLRSDVSDLNKMAHRGKAVVKRYFSEEKFMNIVKNTLVQ